MSIETDKKELLRLHEQWFDANVGLKVDQMREGMAGGDAFHHFNLSGYSYHGVDEITKLWNNLKAVFDLRAFHNETDLRVEVHGDAGWVSVETDVELEMYDADGYGKMAGEGQVVTMPIRITEIYVRNDGTGKPEWKMWHFHCSQRLTEGPRFITE